MTLVLSLFVPPLSFFWCPGRAVVRGCGISCVSLLIFFKMTMTKFWKSLEFEADMDPDDVTYVFC